MEYSLALTIGIIAELLVIGGALAAYRDKFFFVSQMKKRGFSQGFPFVIHGGMWSDFFIISPLMGVLVYFCGIQWSLLGWIIAGIVGLVLSILVHFLVYLKGDLPGSHGYEGRLTIAGWLHLVYTAFALQILALFYFATKDVNHTLLVVTSVVLALHLFTGLIGQVLANKYHPEWFPENPLKVKGTWISIAAFWIFLLVRSWMMW